MMAADTVNHHSYCNHLSLPSSLNSGNQHHNQDVSISEHVDHGSISFGRFVAESLAWEKWSVFSHNRCQEELEKFKSPGLVAQKKAFFEEYYKNIRAMKKLQAEQQETIQSDLCQDGKNITAYVETIDDFTESKEEKNIASHVENSVDIAKSKEEKKFDDAIHVYFPAETNHDKPIVTEEQPSNHNDNIIKGEIKISSAKDESEEQTTNHDDSMIKSDETNICSTTNELEDFGNKADQIPSSSDTTPLKLKASQKDSVVSVKPIAKKLRDLASLSKAKGTITSIRDKTKLDNRTKKDAAKQSEKQKQFSVRESSRKATKNHVLSERAALKPARNVKPENLSSHRPPTKPRSSVTLPHTSVPKERPLSSSSLKGGVAKTNLNPRSSVTLPHTSVPKERPASSSSLKGGVEKTNLNSKGIMSKMQNTSKRITRNNGASVNNVGPGKRAAPGVAKKSLELSSSSLTILKGGLSESQKPKAMSTNISAESKLNKNLGNEVGLTNDGRGNRAKDVSISELVDHGSISFGRFAAESLAWEKWSFFSHNRCQEELEKFKSPGLVAQKKAFFEEYYKKIAAMKKLQAEQQETTEPDLCQDEQNTTIHGENSVDFTESKEGKNYTAHVENGVDTAKSKEEKKFDGAIQNYFSAETNDDKSLVTEEQTTSQSDNIVETGEIKISSTKDESEEQTNNHDDSMVKTDETKICSSTNEPEDFTNKVDQTPCSSFNTCLKALQKDNVVSVKPIAKKIRDHAPLARAKGTIVAKTNLNPWSSVTLPLTSVPKERPMSSSNLKGSVAKTNLNPRSSVPLPHSSAPKERPASSSGLKGGVAKTNLNSKGVMSKTQNTSKSITRTSGATVNMGPGKRATPGVAKNSLELSSSSLTIPKGGLSENPKPEAMSTNLSARNKLNKSLGNEVGFTDVRGNRTNIVPWQSADLTHARREPRPKTPGWR